MSDAESQDYHSKIERSEIAAQLISHGSVIVFMRDGPYYVVREIFEGHRSRLLAFGMLN
jgi:hypothetical protein